MATQTYQSKLVSESIDMTFDMLSRCAIGESVATSAVTVSVASGTDANPTAMLSGSSSVANNIVSQVITGGVIGVIYDVTCSARTTLNNIYINVAKLAVLPDNSVTPPALP